MLPPSPLLDDLHSPPPPAVASSSASRSSKRPSRLASKQAASHAALPDPSSGLLALLVTVAGSSTVDGYPLDADDPPDFLCPRLHAWSLPQSHAASSASAPASPSWYWEPCDASEAAAYVDLAQRRRKRRTRRGSNIADKYVQGSDGRWRKADSWELYGSTSCATSSDCMDVPQATDFPVQDDQISTSTATVAAPSSNSSTPNLPAGWDKDSHEDSMTGMILALSLSLAVALILFMMGVVRWRQKRRTRHKPDAEKTPSSAQDGASVEESEEVRRARTQQRLWARASAKWVANVRQAARRRRKRMASGTVAKDSDGRVMREVQASTSAVSLARTQNANNLDRRQSITSSLRSNGWTRTSSRSPSPAPSHRTRNHDDAPSPPPPHSSQSPPAYPQTSTFQHGRWHSHPLDSAAGSHHHASDIPPPPASPPPHSPIPYQPPLHSAHVAIDDKSVLARMAHLASAPPPSTSEDLDTSVGMHACGPSSPDGPGRSSELRPSVPVLEDDPFEDALPPDIESSFVRDIHTNRWPGPGYGAARSGAPHDPYPPRPRAHDPALGVLELSSMPICHHARAVNAPSADGDSGEDGEIPSYAEDVRLHPPLVLPPPPTKVAPMFYEYPDEFERDVATAEPVMGPSAPPFECEEYAHLPGPPFEDASVLFPATTVASAPPLDLVDVPSGPDSAFGADDLLPSAPPPPSDEDREPGLDEVPHSVREGGGDASDAQVPSAPPDDHGDDGANPGAPPPGRPHPNSNPNPHAHARPDVLREGLDENPGARVERPEMAAPPRYLP